MAWNTLRSLASEEQRLALGLGMQNGQLGLLQADGSKLLLTPAPGLSMPEKTVGVLFSYTATEGGMLLRRWRRRRQLETGIDASAACHAV